MHFLLVSPIKSMFAMSSTSKVVMFIGKKSTLVHCLFSECVFLTWHQTIILFIRHLHEQLGLNPQMFMEAYLSLSCFFCLFFSHSHGLALIPWSLICRFSGMLWSKRGTAWGFTCPHPHFVMQIVCVNCECFSITLENLQTACVGRRIGAWSRNKTFSWHYL